MSCFTNLPVWILTLLALALAFTLISKSKRKATRGSYELRQKHQRINARHLRNGSTASCTLLALACFTCVLLFVPAVVAIIIAVFGAQEPKW